MLLSPLVPSLPRSIVVVVNAAAATAVTTAAITAAITAAAAVTAAVASVAGLGRGDNSGHRRRHRCRHDRARPGRTERRRGGGRSQRTGARLRLAPRRLGGGKVTPWCLYVVRVGIRVKG